MATPDEDDASVDKPVQRYGMCHPSYILSLPGILRVFNIILGGIILGFWIPGYEHDYQNPNQIFNFRDISKHYGAGLKSENLNQFVLADIIISLIFSISLLLAIIIVPQAFVDWNRMNKLAHLFLALFHLTGAVCACIGLWYYEENCCRVDLEWNGIGFRYKPAIREFGYQRQNGHCNCWLTRRQSETDSDNMYSTVLWEPQNYPGNYEGEQNTFVSFAAHHIHLHSTAAILMIFNSAVYALAVIFSKPTPKSSS